MTGEIVPLTNADLNVVSRDFNHLLKRDNNHDIAGEFPNFVKKCVQGEANVRDALSRARESISPGRTEMFIVFSGVYAVGLSVVTNDVEAPRDVGNPDWPNLSGFVCHPFRGRGLGRLSIEKRMEVVDDNFGGKAWTLVRDGNAVSEHLVTSAGFKRVSSDNQKIDNRHLYTYSKDSIE